MHLPAGVNTDWKVTGLEQEDTVAHYDTIDGRTIITPSNKVCLYAPRFAAARRSDRPSGATPASTPLAARSSSINPIKIEETEDVSTSLAEIKPEHPSREGTAEPPP